MGDAGCKIEGKPILDEKRSPMFKKRVHFVRGMRDGIPIMLGYLAVAFTLGIAARGAGLTAPQAALASLLNNASAGEHVGFTLIAAGAGYLEMAVMELVANARYLLMSCALSQKLDPATPLTHRMLIGFDLTDEIFGISMAQPGYLEPWYAYGAMAVAIPGWALGTYLGVLMGNILPARVVSALSVGLYGMFLAVIVPPARKNRFLCALIAIAMAASAGFAAVAALPLFAGLSEGMRIILLTVVISAVAAMVRPVKDEADAKEVA